MLALSDAEGKVWGIFVYHNGSERVLYTRLVDGQNFDFRDSVRIQSFDGPFELKVGTDGTLYTYPQNKKQ